MHDHTAYFRQIARDFDAAALREIAQHAERHAYLQAGDEPDANDAKGRLADLAASIAAVLDLASSDDAAPETDDTATREILERFIPIAGPTFQIFDSMDNPASPARFNAHELWPMLATLEREAESEGNGLTYAIGQTTADGTVTFDF